MRARFRDTVYLVQVIGVFLILGVVIASMIVVASNVARNTVEQTEANRRLIEQLQRVFESHAKASTRQNCAVAQEIAFIVELSPKVTPAIVKQLEVFTRHACRREVVPPIPGLGGGGNGQPFPSGGGSGPGPQPSSAPSGSPSVGPTKPPPSTSPSPTATCLPVIGCV